LFYARDASDVGIETVSLQKQNDEFRIICYLSRTLTSAGRKHSRPEKELLDENILDQRKNVWV